MKRILLGLTLWLSCVAWACDNCNIYLTTAPNDFRNSIGIFMRQRQMFGEYNGFGEMIATRHAVHGNDLVFWGNKVYETYQTYELRGNFYVREKWKTTIVLPYLNNNQFIDNSKRYTIDGIGDPILMQSYQIYSTKRDTIKQKFNQRLMIGAGVKAPLGKTTIERQGLTPNLDLQPGSGSWDGFGFITYAAKYKFMGIESNASLKLNGRNREGYRYGRTMNFTFNLFGDIRLKSSTIRILSGIYNEKANFDQSFFEQDNSVIIHKDTGGKIQFANIGIKFFVRNFLVFGEYQKNIKNELNGYTQLLNRDKVNLGVLYNF